MGLDVTKEGTYGAQNTNPFCQVQFREHLMINAGSSIFVPFAMINPEPLKVLLVFFLSTLLSSRTITMIP